MSEEIKKNKKGYYVQRYFDGKHGIPECTFYLNLKNGEWNDGKLTVDCYFPTAQLALAFLCLRMKYENANHTVMFFESQIKEAARRDLENKQRLEELANKLENS